MRNVSLMRVSIFVLLAVSACVIVGLLTHMTALNAGL